MHDDCDDEAGVADGLGLGLGGALRADGLGGAGERARARRWPGLAPASPGGDGIVAFL